jgi:SAM-dependent methyltransferase
MALEGFAVASGIAQKKAATPAAAHEAPLRLDPSLRCPNCFAAGMKPFYSADNIPVHSTLLMDTPELARAYPRGNLRLAFCPACAFVGNCLYDASVQEYNPHSEESQAFSPTFNKFATGLAQRWVDRYNLRNKTVLEIGCGKADFLMLLCEAGNNRGIGIDPSCQPQRIPDRFRDRVELIQDHYNEKYAHRAADVVLCRHTLEHIGNTGEFLRSIRRTIGNRKETLVLFELPDVVRVLKEGAFWDIYYEHCSYFSPGSLARLFRAAGFDVVELERDYNDQYLLIGAYPAPGPTQPRLPLENDLAQMTAEVEAFHAAIPGHIARWRKTVDQIVGRGQKVVVWGSLSKGVSFLTTLGIGPEVQYVVDINPYRQGKFMPATGHPIIGPAALKQYNPDYAIVMNSIYNKEIGEELARLGLQTKLLAVGVD